MNDYRITYGATEAVTDTMTITERNETAAKKAFKVRCKENGWGPFDIFGVELVQENTCATKQQERETLEAIRKMVEELGPQSYVATAFEGCFEDAEQNIENDFGDSWKRRCESAERKLDEADAEAKEKIAALEAELRKANQGIEELLQKDDERKAAVEQMQTQVLTADDLTDAIQLVSEKRLDLDTEVKNAAERIVETAAEPESAAFKNAVTDHRAAKRDLDYYTALLGRLCAVRDAVTEQEKAA